MIGVCSWELYPKQSVLLVGKDAAKVEEVLQCAHREIPLFDNLYVYRHLTASSKLRLK